MKPQLVDLKQIFEENPKLFSKNDPIIEKKIKVVPKGNKTYRFNYNSLFNFVGVVIIVIGLYFLHRRKLDKVKRSKVFEDRIYKLKDIIKKNDDEFIL